MSKDDKNTLLEIILNSDDGLREKRLDVFLNFIGILDSDRLTGNMNILFGEYTPRSEEDFNLIWSSLERLTGKISARRREDFYQEAAQKSIGLAFHNPGRIHCMDTALNSYHPTSKSGAQFRWGLVHIWLQAADRDATFAGLALDVLAQKGVDLNTTWKDRLTVLERTAQRMEMSHLQQVAPKRQGDTFESAVWTMLRNVDWLVEHGADWRALDKDKYPRVAKHLNEHPRVRATLLGEIAASVRSGPIDIECLLPIKPKI